MTSLDSPEDGMTTVHGSASDPVVLYIESASAVPAEMLEAINECSAFVNWGRMQGGEPAVLALAYWRTQPLPEPPPV